MILSVDNVSKSFGARVLFRDARLRVGARDRVALVGPNGAGKTTLLDIIAGRQDADEGAVTFARDAVVGYLEQEAIEMHGRTVLAEALTSAELVTSLEHRLKVITEDMETAEEGEEQERLIEEYGRLHDKFERLGGYTIESDARAVLFGLGFKETDLTRTTEEFSGGWQMRLALAKLLLRQPDVLLLDEPTNHLDLESVMWLEGFLRAYEGAIMLVSHDRAFIDSLADHVAEIDLGQVKVYTGTYSQYLAARELAMEQLKAAYEAQQKDIAHMEAFVERFRYKASKSKQAQDRMKKLEKMERIVLPEARKTVKFRFRQPPRTGDLVIKLEGVSKAYDDNVVYKNLDFALYRGDKVALVGPERRGQVHAAQDARRRARARYRRADARAPRRGRVLRPAPAPGAQPREHGLPGDRSDRAGVDAVRGPLAARRVPVPLGRGREEGQGPVGRGARAGLRSRRCWSSRHRCCASTSRPTTSTSPRPTCSSRRCSATRAPSR